MQKETKSVLLFLMFLLLQKTNQFLHELFHMISLQLQILHQFTSVSLLKFLFNKHLTLNLQITVSLFIPSNKLLDSPHQQNHLFPISNPHWKTRFSNLTESQRASLPVIFETSETVSESSVPLIFSSNSFTIQLKSDFSLEIEDTTSPPPDFDVNIFIFFLVSDKICHFYANIFHLGLRIQYSRLPKILHSVSFPR